MVNKVAIGAHGYDPSVRFRQLSFPAQLEKVRRNDSPDYTLTQNGSQVNWCDVVTARCYGPTVDVKISPSQIGEAERIEVLRRGGYRIENNEFTVPTHDFLKHTTFDYATPLLMYFEHRFPEVLKGIQRSDLNKNAMSLLFPHHIMPSFESTDVRRVQIGWGMIGFEKFFGRKPDGFWAPEGGLDIFGKDGKIETSTLALAADYGYKYTIVAPHQVKAIRKIEHRNDDSKKEYVGSSIDPSKAYRCFLGKKEDGSDRFIDVIVYDKGVSDRLAFNWDNFYSSKDNLINAFKSARQNDFTATFNDLETQNHHHENTLSVIGSAINEINSGSVENVELTYLNKVLENPPEYEIIFPDEPTSWSCEHTGQLRWGGNGDCRCDQGWGSQWKIAKREAFQNLSDDVEDVFFRGLGQRMFRSPLSAITNYDRVRQRIMDIDELLMGERNSSLELNEANFQKMFRLLELQRLSMVKNTSCGWFFNRTDESVYNMVTAANTLLLLYEVDEKKAEEATEKFLKSLKLGLIEPKLTEVFITACRKNDIDTSKFQKHLMS